MTGNLRSGKTLAQVVIDKEAGCGLEGATGKSLGRKIGPLERIRTSDRLVRRTNKNAGISVITGLAFVAFAGLCITYQD